MAKNQEIRGPAAIIMILVVIIVIIAIGWKIWTAKPKGNFLSSEEMKAQMMKRQGTIIPQGPQSPTGAGQ